MTTKLRNVSGRVGAAITIALFLCPQAKSAIEADLIYDSATGDVKLDPTEAPGGILTNFVLKDTEGGFNAPGVVMFPVEFEGVFKTDLPTEISATDQDGGGVTSLSSIHDLGSIFPIGMSLAELESFLDTRTYVGALGTGVREFDLVQIQLPGPTVPEPTAAIAWSMLVAIGLVACRVRSQRNL